MKLRIKRFLFFSLFVFILLNILAAVHAYRFTHFTKGEKHPIRVNKLSFNDKLKLIFTGIDNPRPVNKTTPSRPFEKVRLQSNVKLECWMINADTPKGTVILFHGYTGEKSGMLDKADEFLKMGYNTMLVDFMGAGGSEGNEVTLGYKEAREVKDVFYYVLQHQKGNVYLLGTSMGAAAILGAISTYHIQPKAIIIECPFATMYQAVKARFRLLHMPAFPMAEMLMFWGGIENDFWAWGHNPKDYAKSVECPVLYLYGGKDDRVGIEETKQVYETLHCAKAIKCYPLAGHEDYLLKYKKEWSQDVAGFLSVN